MSISSSLAAGVSGLSANAQRLATISDNIANSATVGYKRSITDFHAMVVQSGSADQYTAGGVRSTSQRLVDERGQLQTSDNPTDIAINGRGFLPVTKLSGYEANAPVDLSLRTTGTFRPNAEGLLVNPTGDVLLGWPADLDGTFPGFPRDSPDGLQPVNIFYNQFTANPTTEMTIGPNLPYSESLPTAAGEPYDLTIEYFGNLGQTESLSFVFSPTGTENEWTLDVTDSDSGGASVGNYTLQFDDAPVGGGRLQNVVTNAGGAYTPATGLLELTVGGGVIDVDIGQYGDPEGITQVNAAFTPSDLSKNGSSVGNLLGVEIDEAGIVNAVYDSGFTRSIYQVPVVDVPNPNGLTAADAQSFKVSIDSGAMFLWDAGEGPVGETVGNALEASTTDVANELTQLIQTQRAYSSNAKVIQTVDEMLQETTNLKR